MPKPAGQTNSRRKPTTQPIDTSSRVTRSTRGKANAENPSTQTRASVTASSDVEEPPFIRKRLKPNRRAVAQSQTDLASRAEPSTQEDVVEGQTRTTEKSIGVKRGALAAPKKQKRSNNNDDEVGPSTSPTGQYLDSAEYPNVHQPDTLLTFTGTCLSSDTILKLTW